MINSSIKEAFEYLSLNANPGDSFGFCHTPDVVEELVQVHGEVLRTFNVEICDRADRRLYVSESYWDYMIPNVFVKRPWHKKSA
jgi:hypothetical protein